jgi:hypothetical protein
MPRALGAVGLLRVRLVVFRSYTITRSNYLRHAGRVQVGRLRATLSGHQDRTIRKVGLGHRAALRQVANRLVRILYGCLKTSTLYNEATACPTTPNKISQLLLDKFRNGMSDITNDPIPSSNPTRSFPASPQNAASGGRSGRVIHRSRHLSVGQAPRGGHGRRRLLGRRGLCRSSGLGASDSWPGPGRRWHGK